MNRTVSTAAATCLIFVCACQSHQEAVPAALSYADDETMGALRGTLADALGRANVEIGPGDLTATSQIAVLPPPLGPGEDRSPATPVYFDLKTANGDCFVVRQDSGETFALKEVRCRRL